MPLDIHVVSHTHWDREWYHPAGRFRQRLVALIDELLDDPPHAGESFLLDGQAIVLEDYLAVRPERLGELAALLRDGRLEAGPWYVLADELIPGAEALVRNLLAGRRALRALRAQAPPLLYCPDSFGHPAALPELARGFGVRTIVLWRGYGGARWPSGDAARWRAPSGAEALLYHLPPDGYELGSSLPITEPEARARWQRMREVLAPRSALGVLLVQNGADHHARQDGRDDAVAALARAARPDVARGSSLRAFVEALEARADGADLPAVSGELRDSYGYTWALQGTFGARAAQKRRNALAERALVRRAEPAAALARFAAGARSRRPLVDAAWRTLLQCHPHDTLCGCSIDEVARAMDARLDDALAQARGIAEESLLDLAGHDRVAARTRRADWRDVVLVHNPSARPRAGLASVRLVRFVADVPVGPGSAGIAVPAPEAGPAPGIEGMLTEASRGDDEVELTESPRHYPDADLVVAWEALAWVPEVPAYGVLALPQSAEALGDAPPPDPVRSGLDDGRSWMENAALRVEALQRGGITLRSRVDGRRIESLLDVEEQGDRGDLYTPSLRGAPVRWRAFPASAHAEGTLRGECVAHFGALPSEEGPCPFTVTLQLDAGRPFVRLRICGENVQPDHRLRLVVRTGVRDAEVWADAAFGPVRRARLCVPEEDTRAERPPATAPLHRYVSLFGSAGGATLYSDGLAEYEVTPEGDVAVTVVRAVGALSRNDLPERPGHAGWPRETPEAQSIGPFEAELALMLHAGVRDAATVDLIERTADDVLLPLQGATLRSALAVPEPVRGLELQGEGLAFSAAKESDDGAWLVLRCVNLLDVPQDGAWRLGFPITEARRARLDETPGDVLAVRDESEVLFTAAPREVVTVLVR